MKRSLLVFLYGCCFMQMASSQNPEVNTRTIECFDSPTPLVGYDRMQDIVNDQQEEFDRISGGMEPRPPYVFRLCPNTEFDTAQNFITVLLDGIMFLCGPNLSSADNCVFTGGGQQVRFEDSTLEGYPINTASFVGVTFTNFNGQSVNALATAGTTAMFLDCIWRDFNSNFVINMGAARGAPVAGEVMRVEISAGSLIQNGQGGTYFSNDGGTLIFDDVRFENIRAISAIASSTGGVTMMDRVFFNGGDLDSFAFASGGAAHTVVNTTVSGLTGVNDVFSVRGEGATLMMVNTHIKDNLLQGASAFTGVRVLSGATAEVKRSSFTGNTGVSFGFLSRGNGANLELIDVDILSNTGIQGALTAATYVDDSAQLTLRHVIWEDNFVFTAQVFVLSGGTADVLMSCFNSGGGDTILFVSENSAYTDEQNFMSPDMMSTSCRDARDGRLAQENQNSGCFDPMDNSPCSIGCERFGRAPECIQTMAPTTSPSATPTFTASLAPTISPRPTGVGNGATNGIGNGSGNGGPLFPTVSSAPSTSARPTFTPGNEPFLPSFPSGPTAGAPSIFTNPAYAPFFMNPAVAPFFSDPAVSPTVDKPAFAPAFAPALDAPAFAPAFIPSLFQTPTCDPALQSPNMNPSGPLFPTINGKPHYHYKPIAYYSSSSRSKGAKGRKGMRGKKGKGGKAGIMKGMKGMRPGSSWTHHHKDGDVATDPNQHYHGSSWNHAENGNGEHHGYNSDPHHHHPHHLQHHQGLQQDPNQHHHNPVQQQQQPQDDPLGHLQAHIQQFQPPVQQNPPNQHYHHQDPHGGMDSPHQHGQTLYVRDYVEKRVEWGTDHGWNTHIQTDETFTAVRPQHHAATSNRQGRHPRKGRIRRRRLGNLKGVRQELEEEAKAAAAENEREVDDAPNVKVGVKEALLKDEVVKLAKDP